MSALERLEPLIGRWAVRMTFTPEYGIDPVSAEHELTWLLNGAFILHTSSAEDPRVPDGHAIIAPDGDRFAQHYFDSRGLVRHLAMDFDGTTWTSLREPEPPDFHQRSSVRLDPAGDTMSGSGEMLEDGAWRHDFDIVYARVSE